MASMLLRHFYITRDQAAELAALSKQQDRSQAEIIRELLALYLDALKKKE